MFSSRKSIRRAKSVSSLSNICQNVSIVFYEQSERESSVLVQILGKKNMSYLCLLFFELNCSEATACVHYKDAMYIFVKLFTKFILLVLISEKLLVVFYPLFAPTIPFLLVNCNKLAVFASYSPKCQDCNMNKQSTFIPPTSEVRHVHYIRMIRFSTGYSSMTGVCQLVT